MRAAGRSGLTSAYSAGLRSRRLDGGNDVSLSRDDLARRNGHRSAPVRIAVVGLGYWGPNLVRNLHELSEAEVAYVCDGRQEPLDAITRRYPAIAAGDAYETVLADPTVEAVAIATPVSTHFDLASRALEAGKHVFVEKPLAASSWRPRI